MMEELSAIEKFNQGLPVSPELEAFKNALEKETAQEMQQAASAVAGRPLEGVERELTRAERLDLKELRMHAGWPVLLRLLEKNSQMWEKGAISASLGDPLGNKDEVAKQWAYVVVRKRVVNDVSGEVEHELMLLDEVKA